MGKFNLGFINDLSKIRFKPLVNINYKKKAGMIIPLIDYELLLEKQLPSYSFENTSHYLDELIDISKKFFEKLIVLAELEDLMLKFTYTFKKINRRINSLDNIIIPTLQLDIKKIKDIIEESEREEYVRLKITKETIYKKKSVRF